MNKEKHEEKESGSPGLADDINTTKVINFSSLGNKTVAKQRYMKITEA